jgi:hypothetical protein
VTLEISGAGVAHPHCDPGKIRGTADYLDGDVVGRQRREHESLDVMVAEIHLRLDMRRHSAGTQTVFVGRQIFERHRPIGREFSGRLPPDSRLVDVRLRRRAGSDLHAGRQMRRKTAAVRTAQKRDGDARVLAGRERYGRGILE